MADFINTLDLISDDAATKALIERTFTEFSDNNLTNLATYALGGFTYLTNVNLPNATSIGYYAFINCDGLTTIDLPKVTSLGNSAFEGCNELKTVNIPQLKALKKSTFSNCSKLEVVDFPEVSKIDYGPFMQCESLVEAHLPKITGFNGVGAFNGCGKLKLLDFTALKSFNRNDVFGFCYELDTLVLRGMTVCEMSQPSAFDNTKFSSEKLVGKVLVPRALIESYQTATNWSTWYAADRCVFSPLEDWTVDGTITGAIDMNKCLIQFLNNDSTVLQTSIISRGEMPIYSGDGPFEYSESGDYFAGWVPELDAVSSDMKYTAQYTPSSYARAYIRGASYSLGDYVNDTADAIPKYAFYNNNAPISSVTFTKAKVIGENAFYYGNKIESASFPLAKIVCDSAFQYARDLKNINLPLAERVQGFNWYNQLEHVDLPSCKIAGSYLLVSSEKLKTINLPVCESFNGNVLSNCKSLEWVRLPATPPTVYGSDNLTNINTECIFYIPTGSLAAYQAHSWWKSMVSTYAFVEEDRV